MGLTMGERRALTEQVARRYRSAGSKDKAVILGEFVEAPATRASTRSIC